MDFATRSLSPQESRVVLSLTEQGRRELDRAEVIAILGVSAKAADHIIHSLRHKGWLERASWGKYLLIPPAQGPEAIGDSNILALASRVTDPYYIGFGSAATHYGLTTQHRNVIWIVTPHRLRDRRIGDTDVRVVNPAPRKFFGFAPVNVLGYPLMMSDREKTVIDCIDRPDLCGGEGEAAYILAMACRRLDWPKAAGYLDQIGSNSLIQRFGWLVDHAGAEMPPSERERLLQKIRHARRATFGPAAPGENPVTYDETWRLRIHVARADLQASTGLGRRRTIKGGA
jgi:predicted transcriptional regulator of viral defense system